MKTHRLAAAAHCVVWSALALALLAKGAPQIYRDIVTYSLRAPSPFHATDSFLRFATEADVSSEQLMAQFGTMPSSKSVIIFYSKTDPRSSLLGMVTAYLTPPHPVRLLDLGAADAGEELSKIDPETVGALVFCRVPRFPSIPPGRNFGGNLEIFSPSSAGR